MPNKGPNIYKANLPPTYPDKAHFLTRTDSSRIQKVSFQNSTEFQKIWKKIQVNIFGSDLHFFQKVFDWNYICGGLQSFFPGMKHWNFKRPIGSVTTTTTTAATTTILTFKKPDCFNFVFKKPGLCWCSPQALFISTLLLLLLPLVLLLLLCCRWCCWGCCSRPNSNLGVTLTLSQPSLLFCQFFFSLSLSLSLLLVVSLFLSFCWLLLYFNLTLSEIFLSLLCLFFLY